MASRDVHTARFDELTARTFHDIVRLRLDTFVVEQRCAYPELDGRDVVASTLHVWIEEAGTPVSYLRLYPGQDGVAWIGRVVTAAGHRGRGFGRLVMDHALGLTGRPVRISAQSRLRGWYAEMGFARCGDDFLEDGILHTPMRLG